MARPIKRGLDYFPLDTQLKGAIEYIGCMYGKLGEAVITSLWQRIYQSGFYIKYDDRAALVFSKEFGTQLTMCFPEKDKKYWEIFDEIVSQAIEFEVFDEQMYENFGILTSAEIQEIYFEAKKKSRFTELVDENENDYILLNYVKNRINSEITRVNAEETQINSAITPQSKVKESKENKNKVNKSKAEERKPEPTAAAEIDECISAYEKYVGIPTPTVVDGIESHLSRGVEKDLVIRLIEYASEKNARNWQYINAAIIGNVNEGIMTLSAYNAKKSEFGETRARSETVQTTKGTRFNNYEDENHSRDSDINERIWEAFCETL